MDIMNTKTIPIPSVNLTNSNQIQTYNNSLPVISKTNQTSQYPLPDYDSLVQIAKVCDGIKLEQHKLEQKQLQLQTTKQVYKQKLLSEEKDIRSRVITIKKRQNIAQVVEKIRQSEQLLQNKILERIDKYKPAQKLDKNQKHNLFMTLINKVTDVN